MAPRANQDVHPREILIAFGYALGALAAGTTAAVWRDASAPAAAFAVALAAQIPIWMSSPIARRGRPGPATIVFQGLVGFASIVAVAVVSPWFAIPAVIAVGSTVGLIWTRRAAPSASHPQRRAPAGPGSRSSGGVSVQEFRELYPALDQIGVVFSACFAFLTAVCLIAATAGTQALVPAAACAALAWTPALARWLSAKTAPPWVRREVERRRREREAGCNGPPRASS
jgi:hypothetical protein